MLLLFDNFDLFFKPLDPDSESGSRRPPESGFGSETLQLGHLVRAGVSQRCCINWNLLGQFHLDWQAAAHHTALHALFFLSITETSQLLQLLCVVFSLLIRGEVAPSEI